MHVSKLFTVHLVSKACQEAASWIFATCFLENKKNIAKRLLLWNGLNSEQVSQSVKLSQ